MAFSDAPARWRPLIEKTPREIPSGNFLVDVDVAVESTAPAWTSARCDRPTCTRSRHPQWTCLAAEITDRHNIAVDPYYSERPTPPVISPASPLHPRPPPSRALPSLQLTPRRLDHPGNHISSLRPALRRSHTVARPLSLSSPPALNELYVATTTSTPLPDSPPTALEGQPPATRLPRGPYQVRSGPKWPH